MSCLEALDFSSADARSLTEKTYNGFWLYSRIHQKTGDWWSLAVMGISGNTLNQRLSLSFDICNMNHKYPATEICLVTL
jgi:hypothetical protein